MKRLAWSGPPPRSRRRASRRGWRRPAPAARSCRRGRVAQAGGLHHQVLEQPAHQGGRPRQALVGVDGAEHGLQGVGQDRGLVPAALTAPRRGPGARHSRRQQYVVVVVLYWLSYVCVVARTHHVGSLSIHSVPGIMPPYPGGASVTTKEDHFMEEKWTRRAVGAGVWSNRHVCSRFRSVPAGIRLAERRHSHSRQSPNALSVLCPRSPRRSDRGQQN